MEFSDQFTDTLEKELAKRADVIFDRLLKDMDAQMRSRLQDLIEESLSLMVQSLDGVGTASGASAGTGVENRFAQSLVRFVEGAVTLQLNNDRERSSVSQNETARSQSVNQAFKQSRAQSQSALQNEAVKGNRNL